MMRLKERMRVNMKIKKKIGEEVRGNSKERMRVRTEMKMMR